MTPQDRELLEALRRRQIELQRSLDRLEHDISALEATARNGTSEPEITEQEAAAALFPESHLPPPISQQPPPFHPPPSLSEATHLPPPIAHLPPTPPVVAPAHHLPPVPKPSLEFQLGRWLTRIGVALGVITVVFILSLTHGYILHLLGPKGILALCGLACVGLIAGAQITEKRNASLLIFARSLLGLGLAGLYVVLYAAHAFEPVRIIASPIFAGILLVLWSVYVFYLAEHLRSATLAFFAVTLAYFSTAINPVDGFSMTADILLAGAAVFFLLRQGWAAVPYLSLLGTYFAVGRRLIIDENGQLVLDTSRTLPFLPYAAYLLGAWVIFTAAVFFCTSPSFRGARRVVFLSLNNGALAGLLTLTTYLSGYSTTAMGWTLFWTGFIYLVTALIAGGRRPDPGFGQVTSAYFAQGLAVFTLGLMGVWTGITRGLLLLLESFILGLSSTFGRSLVTRLATAIVALLAALFLIYEINWQEHHPWLLGFTGVAVTLLNAWWARGASAIDKARRELHFTPAYYSLLAVALVAAAMSAELSDATLPVALAFACLALTFAVHLFALYELPPVSQLLLLGGQTLVLFPRETGVTLPWESTAGVAICTLVALVWWTRQRVTLYGAWVFGLNLVYSLALTGMAYHALRPHLSTQSWMVTASFLSVFFLLFGSFIRIWPLAIVGQIFLGDAIFHFFTPNGQSLVGQPLGDQFTPFTWNGWAALVPILVTFCTARYIRTFVHEYPQLSPESRFYVRLLSAAYHLAALAMVVRYIFGIVPEPGQPATFLALGTGFLAFYVYRAAPFGVRRTFVLTAIGAWLMAQQLSDQPALTISFLNGLAIFAFLLQPTLLRHAVRHLATKTESWIVIILSAALGWYFVNVWVDVRHHNYVTMGWALYALFIFFFGFLVRERRQRWCGLAILVAAIARVGFADIWGYSTGYKVLTLLVLTLVTLGLGFTYARFAERLKHWL